MKLDFDKAPSPLTLRDAVQLIVQHLDDGERDYIKARPSDEPFMHHGVGRWMRNGWKLWAPDSPLKRDAVATYKIAHADDISGLILDWVWAIVRGTLFDPELHCRQYHDHWARQGMTSLEAGGWPPKEGT